MESRERRAGENEALYREVNERVLELEERFGLDRRTVAFICECSRLACSERIELTPEEYESVRASPTRFVLLPGHEDTTIERILERTERFVVVEKLPGGPAEAAAREDPRS